LCGAVFILGKWRIITGTSRLNRAWLIINSIKKSVRKYQKILNIVNTDNRRTSKNSVYLEECA